MLDYICTLCGARLAPDETVQHYNAIYGETYVICPYCRSECRTENSGEETEDTKENRRRSYTDILTRQRKEKK